MNCGNSLGCRWVRVVILICVVILSEVRSLRRPNEVEGLYPHDEPSAWSLLSQSGGVEPEAKLPLLVWVFSVTCTSLAPPRIHNRMKIAFLGLGNMGTPMARHLLKAGHEVTVWNRTLSKAAELQASGAKVAPTPGEAAQTAEIAITMLADDPAVEASVLGPAGLADKLPKGSVHISCSTISVALSKRLAEEHARNGQHYIAAPVFGRPEAAEARKLFVVAAGKPQTIEHCRPVLRRWASVCLSWESCPRWLTWSSSAAIS